MNSGSSNKNRVAEFLDNYKDLEPWGSEGLESLSDVAPEQPPRRYEPKWNDRVPRWDQQEATLFPAYRCSTYNLRPMYAPSARMHARTHASINTEMPELIDPNGQTLLSW